MDVTPTRSVHLLLVHGVGRHDPLSSLLQTYQAFRANLRSPEAPVLFEDRIPDWRLEAVNEDSAPPFLKLAPRFEEAAEGLDAVYIYEVNYSNIAGVVRKNHRLDLTTLFVGMDMAIAAARQRLVAPAPTIAVGDPVALARCLQRLSGVLAAATVPLIAIPSVFFRDYTETLVGRFTRFFEDIATFAIDKNGEQLVAAHLDRTIDNIVRSQQFASPGARSEFVIAAHSLGSVVVQHHLVRKWTADSDVACLPDRVVTFGSPIGLINWIWLFLDFPGMTYDPEAPTGSHYFCWSTPDNAGKTAKPLLWINVLNGLDPIATAFPAAAADLSRPAHEVRASLVGGDVVHRFCGNTKVSSAGGSHTDYLHDRDGFLEILLRLIDVRPDDPLQVQCTRPEEHWRGSAASLRKLSMLLWLGVVAAAAAYCGLVAWKFEDPRVLWAVVALMSPRAIIAVHAFWQRLCFGGPTKRMPDEHIAALGWWDVVSFPYRLRRFAGAVFGARRQVDLDAPPRMVAMGMLRLVSLAPTLLAMMVPVVLGSVLMGEPPNPMVFVGWHVAALLLFSVYLAACTVHELVVTWRAVLRETR